MSVTKRVGLLAGAATLSLTGASLADVTAGADNNELRNEVDALKAEVAELRANQSGDFMTEERADQIRGLVQDVLADADTRSSLLQGGPTAGHDGNFFLASPDGNYRLNVGGLLQTAFVFNNVDNGSASGDEDRWGFEVKRAQLSFWGHVVNPNWMYKIEAQFGRGASFDPSGFFGEEDEIEDILDNLGSSSGSFGGCNFCLLDAWIAHNCGNGLVVYVGQFRAPFLHEELVDDQFSLAYDRSVLNEAFTSGYIQGIMAHYRQDVWEIMASFDDGPRTANTSALSYDTEYSFHVRGNWLIAGTWDQQDQHTSPRGQEFGARVGGGIRYMELEYGTLNSEIDMFSWTIDGSVHFGGASIMAAIIGNHIDSDVAGFEFDPIGIMVQGGFYLTDEWELFGRYEWGDPDIPGVPDLSLLTFGVNYYFAGQQVKWTADVVFGLEEVSPVWTLLSNTGDLPGIRPNAAGEDGQIALRTQLQLMF